LLAAEVVVLTLFFAASLTLVGRLADSVKASQSATWLLLGQSTGTAIDGLLVDALGDLRDSAVWYREAGSAERPDEAQSVLDLTQTRSPVFTNGVVVIGPNWRVQAADGKHSPLLGSELPTTSLAELPASGRGGPFSWGATHGAPWGDSIAIAVPLGADAPGSYLVGLVGVGSSEIDRVLAAAVRLGQSGHAEIVDPSCRVVFATEAGHFLSSGEHPTFCRASWPLGQARIGEAASEMPEMADLMGTHLMAFVPLQTLPWALEIGTSTAEAYGPADQLRNGSIAALLAFTTLAFLATVLLARKMVEPITSLSEVARRIAGGEHTAEIHTSFGGEIGELARSLETMRLRLAGWASALEAQVRARTAELEQRSRELSALFESLRRQEAQRQTLLGRILSAQEDERRRVSRELHDSIGQTFWALTLGLERLQNRPDCPPEMQRDLVSLQNLASESLADLRRLTVALRPAALDDLGLVPAIRRYAELYLNDAGITFEIDAEGLGERLNPFLESVVYRVVQEAINNVARHSGATAADIHLQRSDDRLVARVSDNGRGFDPATREPGVGLQGMDERALLVGGKITLWSAPGKGTTVTLMVPLTGISPGGSDEQKEAAAG
jgi:signal transduction histidine kinase